MAQLIFRASCAAFLLLTGSCSMTDWLVATVEVAPATDSVQVGATLQLTATPKDRGGNELAGRVVIWASSATGVATVDGSSGLVTGVAVGSATIRATSEGIEGTAAVTVTAVPVVPVASVTVTPAAPSILVGNTVQLTATTKDAGGATLTGRTVSWTSSNSAIATVNGNGLVNAVGVGTDTITATSESVAGRAVITVELVPVALVTVSPSTATVALGATQQLTATTKDAGGATLTGRTVSWTSSNSAIATVNGNGLVNAVGAGTDTITATSESVTGTAVITVPTGPGAAPVFSDGLETGVRAASVGGYGWGTNAYVSVSNDRGYGGSTHSLKFPFGPTPPLDQLTNTWAEQRFIFGAYLTEVWLEYQLYVPANFFHRIEPGSTGTGGVNTFTLQPAGSWETWAPPLATNYLAGTTVELYNGTGTVWTGPVVSNTTTALTIVGDATGATRLRGVTSNNKFLNIWRDSYGWIGDFHFIMEYQPGPPENLKPFHTASTSVVGNPGRYPPTVTPFISATGPITIGAWTRIRIHIRMASAALANDGLIQVWAGTTKVWELAGDFYPNADGATPIGLHNGYLLGAANSGFTDQTIFYVDDFKIFSANPLW